MDTKSRIKYTKNIEERAKELTKANKLPKSILNRLKSKENK